MFFCRETMRVGRSKHWKDVIRSMTRGQYGTLSADAMLRYFQPLELWLRVQNHNELTIGWKPTLEDTSLFQPLHSGASRRIMIPIFFVVNLMMVIFSF